MDNNKLLKQVQDEYLHSYNYIDAKKEKRRDDMSTYLTEAEEDKINTNTVFVAVNTLMSVYWNNKIVTKWKGRDRFDRERAVNTNKIAKFDYKEMGISKLDYVLEFYRFMTGVGVQIGDGFDFASIVPKLRNVNPLSCYPDPQGGPTIDTHRFFGFEVNMSPREMKKMKFKNIDKLDGLSENEIQNKQQENTDRGYNFDFESTVTGLHTVYFHFTRFEGKTYVVTTDPSQEYILRIKELVPVTDEEKKDNSKICYPIGLKYYSYIPGDFYSASVPDLMKDKQTMYGKLFNALLAMAIRNAYGDDRFIDANKVKDVKGLRQPTLEGKIVPVKLGAGESIQNAVYQMSKDNPGNVPFNVKQYLEEISALEVGIDRNTSGVLSTQNATLGEREMAQRNANVRFMLATKQGNWFEEFRWKQLWYRMYQANLKSIDEKTVFFDNAYSETNVIFKKDDFVGRNDLRLELINKAEEQQEMMAKKADRMALLPQLIAGAKSEDERVILYRELLEAQGEDEEYIMGLFPLTATELKAYGKLEAINENDIRGAMIESLDEDHNIYIRIFRTADDTPVKEKAIQARYQAIAYTGQNMMQENEALDSAQNVSSAQLTAASINEGSNGPSLQDITQ